MLRYREQLQDLSFCHIGASYRNSCIHLTESFQQVEKVKVFKNKNNTQLFKFDYFGFRLLGFKGSLLVTTT